MTQVASVLHRIASLLDAAGIPFMVAGSFASSVHGKPRTTLAVHLVIDVDRERVEVFV